MTTTIDTNVLVAFWDRDDALNSAAQSALSAALGSGALTISPPVFAELMAAPGRTEEFLDSFFEDTGITVDWSLDEAMWRSAGRAFQAYVARRKKHGDRGTRRVLADFVIGAYALKRGYRLLTLDDRIYHAAFPSLTIITA